MKLLVCAQDVGSTLQNVALIDSIIRMGVNIKIQIITLSHLRRHYEEIICHRISMLVLEFFEGQRHLEKILEKCVLDFAPDYIVVGLSVVERQNIDHSILKIAMRNEIHTGCIQDYWGNVGSFKRDECPDDFFVIDDVAKIISKQKLGLGCSNFYVTGSPKHFGILSDHTKKQSFDAGYEFDVVFFLQPSDIPGIKDNLEIFVSVSQTIFEMTNIAVKIHPAERYARDISNLLNANGCADLQILGQEIENFQIFHKTKLVVTCYSTVGLDLCYFQAQSEKPLADLIYLTCGDDIQSVLDYEVGSKTVPGTQKGLGRQLLDAKRLKFEMFRSIKNGDLRKSFWSSCKRELASTIDPSKRIVERIFEVS